MNKERGAAELAVFFIFMGVLYGVIGILKLLGALLFGPDEEKKAEIRRLSGKIYVLQIEDNKKLDKFYIHYSKGKVSICKSLKCNKSFSIADLNASLLLKEGKFKDVYVVCDDETVISLSKNSCDKIHKIVLVK